MTLRDAVGIFVRTFAALASAALVAVQGYDWAGGNAIANNGLVLALALGACVAGALIAAGWAFVRSPATSPVEKATRAFVEKVVAGVGVIAFNSVADVVALGQLLPPLLIGGAFAFAITLLSYVAPPAVPEPSK